MKTLKYVRQSLDRAEERGEHTYNKGTAHFDIFRTERGKIVTVRHYGTIILQIHVGGTPAIAVCRGAYSASDRDIINNALDYYGLAERAHARIRDFYLEFVVDGERVPLPGHAEPWKNLIYLDHA